MADERKISVAEVRKTISASLAAAFGFVIALMWAQVVNGGLNLAGISTTAPANPASWAIFAGTAVVMTVVMIVFIVVISRWGSKGEKKA